MADPAEQPDPVVDDAAELEAAVRQAIDRCGGDPVDVVRALIVANAMLERELADVYAKASKGFLRGRRVPLRTDAGAASTPGSRRRDP
jgi:enoyl-CoA hydratase/carnithine racemase